MTIRRTITNTTGATVESAKLRVSSISQANGAPRPGTGIQPTRIAQLRVVDPGTPTSTITVPGGPVTVQNLSVDAPVTGGPGGLNSTLTIPLGGGLAPGASTNVAITFEVVTTGAFWIGYDVEAITASCDC